MYKEWGNDIVRSEVMNVAGNMARAAQRALDPYNWQVSKPIAYEGDKEAYAFVTLTQEDEAGRVTYAALAQTKDLMMLVGNIIWMEYAGASMDEEYMYSYSLDSDTGNPGHIHGLEEKRIQAQRIREVGRMDV